MHNKLQRYPVLCVLLVLTHLLCSCTPDIAPATAQKNTGDASRPNVLIIVANDLGWADLNCYGSHLVESPNLDKLARNGLQFMQGYAAAPVSSPTRASIQTGLYPARLGLTDDPENTTPNPAESLSTPGTPTGLDSRYLTLGKIAKTAGYQTAHLGKWHLGSSESGPENQGYDLTYAAADAEKPTSYYYPFFEGQPFPELLADTKTGDYLTDALTDKALSIMEGWGENPWLISLNYFAPEAPIEARRDWSAHYQTLIEETHWRPFPLPEYAAMVSTLDENIGRLIDYLDDTEALENTLIVFVSDNGGLHVPATPPLDQFTPPTNNGILRAGKGYLHEGGIRIPFILHYPALSTGRNASLAPVITNDILPTVAEAIGQSRTYTSTDGRSLLPLLRGKNLPRRQLYLALPALQRRRAAPRPPPFATVTTNFITITGRTLLSTTTWPPAPMRGSISPAHRKTVRCCRAWRNGNEGLVLVR